MKADDPAREKGRAVACSPAQSVSRFSPSFEEGGRVAKNLFGSSTKFGQAELSAVRVVSYGCPAGIPRTLPSGALFRGVPLSLSLGVGTVGQEGYVVEFADKQLSQRSVSVGQFFEAVSQALSHFSGHFFEHCARQSRSSEVAFVIVAPIGPAPF